MAVRDAPLEPARCRAGRNRTSEAGDLGFPAGGGGFGIGEEGWEGHWEKRRRVRREEKQPGDGDSGSTINGCSSQQAARWALLPHTTSAIPKLGGTGPRRRRYFGLVGASGAVFSFLYF